MQNKSLKPSFSLNLTSNGFLFLWCFIASFPIIWITIMSFKIPLDAFSNNPLNVIFGPKTNSKVGGISIIDFVFVISYFFILFKLAKNWLPIQLNKFAIFNKIWISWLIGVTLFTLLSLLIFFAIILPFLEILNSFTGFLGKNIIGLTIKNYQVVWIDQDFTNNFKNSLIVTFGVVTVSLSVGTLAGYGLARSTSKIAFWLLLIALVFRALPHSVLVTGYLPFFINSSEILKPILGEVAPTLYGKPWAVIAVLVAINQPFTIWMLRSFFQNIPSELDDAARVDGCSHFQAFVKIIMPIMWPGVITTGLFSFLLAYNDYLVTSLLLSDLNMTMVPSIASMFGRETTATHEVQAIAAAVSITAPLFLLVMVFQRQIVSGLTAGAVKG